MPRAAWVAGRRRQPRVGIGEVRVSLGADATLGDHRCRETMMRFATRVIPEKHTRSS